ncbi:uncharacterized protein LOC144053189 isoform X1 [Vanacampus margaritifer]
MWPNQGPSNPAFPPGYNQAYPPAYSALPTARVDPPPPYQQYPPIQYPRGVNPAMIPNAPRVATPYVGGPGPHIYPVAPGGYPYPTAPVGGFHSGAYPCSPKGYQQHHYKGHYYNNGHLYHGGIPLRGGIGGALTGMAMGLVAHKAHKKLKKGKKLKKVHKLYKHGYYGGKVRLTTLASHVQTFLHQAPLAK